jgi:hypothetical protein
VNSDVKTPILAASPRYFFDVIYEVVKKHVEVRVCPSVVKYRCLNLWTSFLFNSVQETFTKTC